MHRHYDFGVFRSSYSVGEAELHLPVSPGPGPSLEEVVDIVAHVPGHVASGALGGQGRSTSTLSGLPRTARSTRPDGDPRTS